MLTINLLRFADQVAKGEILSMQDERVIQQLYAVLTRDADARQSARLALRLVLDQSIRDDERLQQFDSVAV